MPRTSNALRTAHMRDQVLDAAIELVRRIGPARMTMEGVAAQAQVSKGGVLHHFRSKEALVAALVARILDQMRDDVAEEKANLPPSETSATLRANARHARSKYEAGDSFPRALMLAAFEQPEALQGFRSFLADQVAAIRFDSSEPTRATIGLFAIIGIMLLKNLDICTLDNADIGRVLDAVERSD